MAGSLIIACFLIFSTFAIIVKGNFNTFFGGKGVISSMPVPPENRQTKVISYNNDNHVIESGYNYVFETSDNWGTKENPIDLAQFDITPGTKDQPLDAYIDGKNNYFKIDLDQDEAKNGIFGVISGAIVNLNLIGNVASSEKCTALAAVLEVQGVLYNCNNYIDISSYGNNEYAAGLVGEVKGKIIKCNNYGKIMANGYASGLAYKVIGDVIDSKNYGEVQSMSSKAAGVAGVVTGTVKNCQNLANIRGNEGAAGIAVDVIGGSIIGCVNGSSDKKIQVYASSAYSVGIIYNLISTEQNLGKVSKCINYSNIDGNYGACGIGFEIDGDIEDTKNYGDITSHSTAVGIAKKVKGNISNTQNLGSIIGDNDFAIGIVLDIEGDITNCNNSGYILTSGGNASGIAYRLQGNITGSKNTATVQKKGWGGDKNVAGIAAIAYGLIENCINNGQIIVDHIAQYVGGIAGEMTGKIFNCESNGKIRQYDLYTYVNVGGIAAVLNNNSQYGMPIINNCIVTGGLDVYSTIAGKGIIAYQYPKGSIVNCIGMGQLYNL